MKSLMWVFCDFPCLPEGSRRAQFWKFPSAGAVPAAADLPSWLELKGLDDQSLHMQGERKGKGSVKRQKIAVACEA